MSEACLGCGHNIEGHYQNVIGNVFCFATESGVSSRGVIGLPYTIYCDCKNYHSVQAKVRAEDEAYEEQRHRDAVERIKTVGGGSSRRGGEIPA